MLVGLILLLVLLWAFNQVFINQRLRFKSQVAGGLGVCVVERRPLCGWGDRTGNVTPLGACVS